MIWLGAKRGYLTDWLTQCWVKATGRRIDLAENPWADGPVGDTTGIGADFFMEYASKHRLDVVTERPRGLLQSFAQLSCDGNDLGGVAASVRHFYECTSEYELDAWAEWRGVFKPFGRALGALFSRRLQQLNVPLSALDTSRGISSEVIHVRECVSGRVIMAGWVRRLCGTQNVLYAGGYSVARVPRWPAPCVKVVFPLPNGNAIVVMKASTGSDASLSVTSAGRRFGDPGFYFAVHDGRARTWIRYVASIKETIRVYDAETGTVRADHILWIWGIQFLRLHYRMRTRTSEAAVHDMRG